MAVSLGLGRIRNLFVLGCMVCGLALSAAGENVDLASLPASVGIRIDGAAADDLSGMSVSTAGDMNGDGYADLVVGAAGADNNGRSESGSAYVLFGKASGFSTVDLASLSGANGYRIDGAAATDYCSMSVSTAGDVNGDGYADLIVGAPGADNNGRSDSGSAYVLFGKASGFSTVDLASLSAADGYRIDGAAAGDACGLSVSTAGDVNGDGYADLIVAAYGADNNARSDSGSVYVLFGKASGFSTVDLASLSAAAGYRIDGAAPGDYCAVSVSTAGDVNGDGYADLVVGASSADNNGRPSSGSAYVVFGKASGFSTIDLASLGAANGYRIDGAAPNHYCAASVSTAGDVNGDGHADLIIGATGAEYNGRTESGSAYVLFGKASGFSTIDLASLSAADGYRIDAAASADTCGQSVSTAGDVNADGYADLIVGAYETDYNGRINSGSAYVLFGKASGFSNVDLASLSAADGYHIDGAAVGDGCGYSVSTAGDVNGDGYPDPIVVALFADNNARSDSGSVYVLFRGGRQTTYSARTPAGNAPRMAVGASKDGIPASCVWLDFGAGNATSTETVTVYSRGNPVSGLTPWKDTNDFYWKISTTRTGWTTATLTIRYPRSAEPYESDLRIYKAESSSGPWTRLDTTVNTARHEVSATVTGFSWFALGKSNVLPLGLSSFRVE